MNLTQFLSKLTSANIQVTVVDLTTDNEIVSMKSNGYTALDDSVESREVMQWSIVNASHIRVVLGDVLTTETEEPTSGD